MSKVMGIEISEDEREMAEDMGLWDFIEEDEEDDKEDKKNNK